MKYHYYMVSGKCVAYPVDKPEEAGPVHMNAILTTEGIGEIPAVTAKDLGKAQQALQIQLHNRMKDEEVKVVDVVLDGLSYLGYMEPEHFLPKVEEGLKAGVKAAKGA